MTITVEVTSKVAAASRTKIIDSDVHPWINGDIKGLMPYLSTAWQRRFAGSKSTLPDHPLRPPLAGATSIRRDTKPPGGGAGGSDPEFMLEDHLDQYDIEYAVLSSIQSGKLATLPNTDEAITLARAFNDYFMNEWLTVDSRYRLAMCVAAHDPLAANEEIRRIGNEEGVVAVFIPLLNILMGNRHYYPIYQGRGAWASGPNSSNRHRGRLPDQRRLRRGHPQHLHRAAHGLPRDSHGKHHEHGLRRGFRAFPWLEGGGRGVRVQLGAAHAVEDGPELAGVQARGSLDRARAEQLRPRSRPIHEPAGGGARKGRVPAADSGDGAR